MASNGQAIIDLGRTRIGQKYVFGVTVPLDNPDWKGPWDCAEFASWCAYQCYGLIFGAGATEFARANPYSGYWLKEAKTRGRMISWRDALKIPGAALIRAPHAGVIGHVAFAVGDGESTLEARGAKYGVGEFSDAKTRAWTIGCLLPDVAYAEMPIARKPARLPKGHFWLKRPNFKGPEIVALQRALSSAGFDPGPVDGVFGPFVNAALLAFQEHKGIDVDGVFGREAASALNLTFPVTPTAADNKQFIKSNDSSPIEIEIPPSDNIDNVVRVFQKGDLFSAKTKSGLTFVIGARVSYKGGRVGVQSTADAVSFGAYKAADFVATLGKWAYFIEPTLRAESAAAFAAVNAYDRAAFTFGAPQFAAHTPKWNFVVYLRRLLELPSAKHHFSELSLRADGAGRRAIHVSEGATIRNLEKEYDVPRPGGKVEKQLLDFMAYLNERPDQVDSRELLAAARLINWIRLEEVARALQIVVFIDHTKLKFAAAKQKVQNFPASNWRLALWILDILHQGRGRYDEISKALSSSAPEAALKSVGLKKTTKHRISTIANAIADFEARGVLTGFEV